MTYRAWVCVGAAALGCACGSAGGGVGVTDAGAGSGGKIWGAGGSAAGGSAAGGSAAGGGPNGGGFGGTGAESGGGGAEPTGGSGGGPAGTPAEIQMLSGNGAALLENWPGGTLKVRIRDAAGAPVPNQKVTWSVISGEGANLTSPSQPTDTTDASGIAARMIQGVGFNASKPYGETVIRASSSVGTVDFVAVTVHQTSSGPIGALIVLTDPVSYDFGTVKAGSTLKAAAKLQVVVQAGVFSGTPLPNVALRFVDPQNKEVDGVANCTGGAALTNASGIATCDLVVGNQLGNHSIAALGGEATIFSAMHLNIVP